MSGDDWYVDMVRAGDAQGTREAEAAGLEAREALTKAGAGPNLAEFDLPAMRRGGAPMDGTVANQYALPGAKVIGKFDARNGKPLDTRSELEIQRDALLAAAGNVGATVASGAYEFGRGIVNLSADIYEGLGGTDAFRPPPSEDVGIPEPIGLAGEMGEGFVKYGLGFAVSFSRLTALSSAPTTVIGRAASTSTRAAGAGAVVDYAVMDPREESLYSILRESFGMESEAAKAIDPALLAEESPMTARAAMAVEGFVTGGVLGIAASGISKGAKGIAKATAFAAAMMQRGSELEGIAIGAMAKKP